MANDQEIVDRFYMKHGPCCAGCDWWHHLNSVAGECRRSAPVSGTQRLAMLGITGCSLPPASGHVLTPRRHHCGEFRDEYDWTSLPLHYLRLIGWTSIRSRTPSKETGADLSGAERKSNG